YESKVKGKVLLLDNPPPDESERKRRKEERNVKRRRKRDKVMGSKERKRLGLWDVPKEVCRYANFLPLHELWVQYMNELVGPATPTPAVLLPKMTKADFHGAIMTVTRSKCPANVGLSGIVIKETENMFYIVTKDDKSKMIPKQHHVFTLKVRDALVTLYGNQFVARSAERAAKKFKSKPTVEL
ncbi:RNase P/RNase MRP complex subunit, partial [Borealophlyctis nickersoniae]